MSEKIWTIKELIESEPQKYKGLDKVQFLDKNKNSLNDINIYDIYNYTEYIKIENEEELNAVNNLGYAFAFTYFIDIKEIGFLKYSSKQSKFKLYIN